jgi:peptidylprolyl isomerase
MEVAVLETTKGTLEIGFYGESAPLAVQNFKTHVRQHYYDGTRFHRIIPNFVIQGGDPMGTGMGGESIWGEPFVDEFDIRLRFDRRGLVGMANSGPNSNRSQFFIALAATPWLNDHHTLFGWVIASDSTIAAIERTGSLPNGTPTQEVRILHAFLHERPVE